MSEPGLPPLVNRGRALTRRGALGLVAAGTTVALAGCTADDEPQSRRSRRPARDEPTVDPDVELAVLTLAATRPVLDAAQRTRDRHARLRVVLAPVVAAHADHVRLLAAAAPAGPSGSASGSAAPSLPPSPSDTATAAVPAGAPTALRRLVRLESELSTVVKRNAFRADSGPFARLLASMAASTAQHVALLTDAAARLGRDGRG